MASEKQNPIPLKSSILNLPVESIKADYGWNVRSRGKEGYRGITELAEDIKRVGLLNPVVVRPGAKEGQYVLVAGFRRYDAVRSLGQPVIEAKIVAVNDLDATLLNTKENVARDQITTHDLAIRCVMLRDSYGLSQARIATEFAAGTGERGEGMSRSYIGNLMRAAEKLHPKILEAWGNEESGLTTDLLVKWSALDHDEQVMEWNKLRGAIGEDEVDETGERRKGKAKPRKPGTASVTLALAAVKESNLSESVKDSALSVFAFTLGKAKTLRIGGKMIYDPKAKPPKDADTKE